MRPIARRVQGFAYLALALLAIPALGAEATADVVSPIDVTYRESPGCEDECIEDADCGPCQACNCGRCFERYWGTCKYGGGCGSYHHCVTYEDACERRCEPNPVIPTDAVSCQADADCPSCRYCLLGYCEGASEWRIQFCNLTIPESCNPGMHCAVNEDCEGTWCVPDDPLPEPEADATASIPDADATAPEPDHLRGGGCALPGGPASNRAAFLLLVCGGALALAARKRAELTGQRRGG